MVFPILMILVLGNACLLAYLALEIYHRIGPHLNAKSR